MKKYIFFDLDGTLTDSAEGITNSVAYVLKYYGISVKDKSTLNVFVGPPLVESFMKYYGFDREQARASVESILRIRGCLKTLYIRASRNF